MWTAKGLDGRVRSARNDFIAMIRRIRARTVGKIGDVESRRLLDIIFVMCMVDLTQKTGIMVWEQAL